MIGDRRPEAVTLRALALGDLPTVDPWFLRSRHRDEGEGPAGPIVAEVLDLATGSIAFVIDPQLRCAASGAA